MSGYSRLDNPMAWMIRKIKQATKIPQTALFLPI
jgi:hypothetical protein